MKIRMMSEAAKLAVDCVYKAHICGFNVKNQDYALAEKIVFDGISPSIQGTGIARMMARRLQALGDMKTYFEAMEQVVNMVAADDFALKDLAEGKEERLRNDLQYLVCMADHAQNEMEAKYEEARKKAFKTAKAAS